MAKRSIILAAGLLAAAALGLAACEETPVITVQPAAPRPEPASRPTPAPKPLPRRALVKLEALKPLVARPVNRPQAALPQRAAALLAEARRHMQQRRVTNAVQVLERAKGFSPNDPRIHRTLGIAQMMLNNPGLARESLMIAAQTAPDDATVQIMLGKLAAAAGNRDEAMMRFRTALVCTDAGPRNAVAAEALVRLGAGLQADGFWTASLQCWDRFGEWIALEGRDYVRRPALRRWAMSPELLHVARGRLLVLLRRYPEAAEQFERAHRRDQAQADTARLLIESLILAKDFGRAEKTLVAMSQEPAVAARAAALAERLIAAAPDEAMIGRLWRAHTAGGRLNGAFAMALAEAALERKAEAQSLAIAREVLKNAPDNASAARLLCRVSIRQGRALEALSLLAETLTVSSAADAAVREGVAQVAAAGIKDQDRALARRAMADRSDAKAALHYISGLLATAAGRQLLAADQFERAVATRKDFLAAYEALLDVYLAQKEYEKADRIVRRVRTTTGDGHLHQFVAGKVLLARGKNTEAIAAFIEARRLKDRHVPTLLNLAEAYRRVGQHGQAGRTLTEAIKIEPDTVDLYTRLFRLLMDSGNRGLHAEARRVTDTLLARHPNSIAGRLMRLELALIEARGDPRKRPRAMKLLAELRRDAPDNPQVALMALSQQIPDGPGKLSEEVFNRTAAGLGEILRSYPRHLKARRMLAALFARQGRADEALSMWGQVYREYPDRDDLARQYVRAAVEAGQLGAAAAALDDIIRRRPAVLWAKLKQLEVLGQLKQYDRVAARAKTFLARAEGRLARDRIHRSLLAVYLKGKVRDRAHVVLDAWLASGPEHELAETLREAKVRLYCEDGAYDQAADFTRKWAEDSDAPDRPRALLLELLAEAKAYDRAHALLDKWLEAGAVHRPNRFWYRKLAMYGRVGRTDEVVASARRWVKAGGGDAAKFNSLDVLADSEAYVAGLVLLDEWLASGEGKLIRLFQDYRVEWLCRAGRADEAVVYANKLIAKSPWELRSRRALVAGLFSQGKHRRAQTLLAGWLARLSAAAASRPATRPATQPAAVAEKEAEKRREVLRWHHRMMVVAMGLGGDNAGGARRARTYLAADPKDTDLLVALSTCLSELGRDDEALKVMEKAHAIKPTDPGLNNNLGYMYADRGVDLDRAERMIRLAVRARDEAAFRDSLGWVFYKRGLLQSARQHLEQALGRMKADREEHPVIYDHLGDTYYRIGLVDEAARLWRRAVELAGKEKYKSVEIRGILTGTAAKLKAVAAKGTPKVAPLGKGVKPREIRIEETDDEW